MKIGISGHQRIPAEALQYIESQIELVADRAVGNLIGISSLAAGADQVFSEVILRKNGNLHVILPCANYETTFLNPRDLERFSDLLSKSKSVETLNHDSPSEEAFFHAGRRVVEDSDLLVAVWDGRPAQGLGGTADVVDFARRRASRVEIIWPPELSRT